MTSPLANIYARLPVSFTHGQGVWLWDAQGRKYLDALAGIGVSCLGHAHPRLVAAISEQAARVIHTSNIYEVPQQTELAARLARLSGMRDVVFNNSGSEANEAAIKLARYYAYRHGNSHAHIITMDSSWHGRTLATLAATGSDKARKGFEPCPRASSRCRTTMPPRSAPPATPSRAWPPCCSKPCRAKAASVPPMPPSFERYDNCAPSAAGC